MTTLEPVTTATAVPRPAVPPDGRGPLTVYLLLLFVLPAQLVIGPLGAPGAPAALVALGLLVWWAAGRMLAHPLSPAGRHPVRLVLTLLTVATLMAYTVGMVRGLAGLQVSAADRGLLSMFGWIGLALVACDMLHTRESIDRLLRLLVFLGAFIAVLGILQFAVGFDLTRYLVIPGLTPNRELDLIGERSNFRRVAGTTSHPIEFGVVLAAILPIALHYALDDRRGRWWVRWGVVAVITAAIPMSVSRSAMLGLGVGILLLFLSWSGWRRMLAILILPLVLVAMRAAVPGLLGTIRSLFSLWSNDPSIQGRTDDYGVIGTYIAQSPWFGSGFETFLPKEFVLLDNQYLGTIVEMGIVGLLVLLTLFAVAFGCARGVVLRAPDPVTRSLGVSLSASIAVLAFSFATFDGLGFPVAAGILFLLLGVIGALWRLAGGPAPVRRIPRRWRRRWKRDAAAAHDADAAFDADVPA